jgi:hypothetical protein
VEVLAIWDESLKSRFVTLTKRRRSLRLWQIHVLIDLASV